PHEIGQEVQRTSWSQPVFSTGLFLSEVSDATTIHEQRVNEYLVSEGTAYQEFRLTHVEPDGCHIVICSRI
ncbi:hypothetical protein, partial [Haloquadratum walsbyi]|uniref:hypothetical protein n=1 Tax=Haloquadratum walsbyi TaxID=293091 RepID=UPI001AD8F851